MTGIQITVKDGKAYIVTPYSPDFVSAIKRIGGARWSASEKAWVIPETEIVTARAIIREVYGADDTPVHDAVRVRLTFTEEVAEWCGPIILFGYVLSNARGRDSGSRCGDGVIFTSGAPRSGGSMKNWKSIVPAGSVVELAAVSRSALADAVLPSGCTAEIIAEQKVDVAALMQERKTLMERIAEIDALIAEA